MNDKGFSLVSALFLVVVLSLVASYIVNLAGLATRTNVLGILGARAYYAAKSGLEWGTYQVVTNNVCPTSPTVLTLTQGGLAGYSVSVTCVLTTFVEGTVTDKIFEITATGSYGSYNTVSTGKVDYASRQLKIFVVRET